MFACRNARGLLAQREYERLTHDDASWLDNHLERCASCRREAAHLSGFAAAAPAARPELAVSLLPRVRANLGTAPAPNRLWRWAASAIAVTALVLIAGVAMRPQSELPGLSTASEGSAAMANVMGKARRLMDESKPQKALLVLRAAVDRNKAPQSAGVAYGLLGDAAFLARRYEEAHAYYQEARRNHEGQWLASITVERSFRVNLLEETRGEGYMPLHDLDFAYAQGGSSLTEYEQILARHPDAPHLAALATARMCDAVAPAENGSGAETRLAALRSVRARCEHPIALGQIDIEMGRLHSGMGDLEGARLAFERASTAPDPAVAERAAGLLARVTAGGE